MVYTIEEIKCIVIPIAKTYGINSISLLNHMPKDKPHLEVI